MEDKVKEIMRALIQDNKLKRKQLAFYKSQTLVLSEEQLSKIKALNQEAEELLSNINEV